MGLVVTYSLQVHKMNTQWGFHIHMFLLPNQLTHQMMIGSCVFTPCSCWLFWSFWGMYCFCLQVNWLVQVDAEVFGGKKCWLHRTVWGSLAITATEGKGSKLMGVDISNHRPVLSGLHQWETKIILCKFWLWLSCTGCDQFLGWVTTDTVMWALVLKPLIKHSGNYTYQLH
jgi:hypothetical protein